MSESATAYLQQLKALLPRGLLWNSLREEGKLYGELLHAIAEEFARVDASNDNLIVETDPRTTYYMLPDFEAFASLPTICSPAGLTLQERRDALEQQLTGDIANSIPGIEAMAAAMGIPVTIREHRANRYGSSYGGQYGGTDWQLTWDVVAPATTVTRRRYGNPHGERYARWGYELLECAIKRVAPAGFVLRFVYE